MTGASNPHELARDSYHSTPGSSGCLLQPRAPYRNRTGDFLTENQAS